MAEYTFRLIGRTPLLMHSCDVLASDTVQAWQKDPRNKNLSVPGDDRSPPWTWMTYVYHDGEHIVMPSDNVSVALRVAGAKVKLKGNTTFKSLSQSGIFIKDEHFRFTIATNGGRQIPMADVESFRNDPFPVHVAACKKLGFELFAKRATVNGSKHVRIRPIFKSWEVSGSLETTDSAITTQVLEMLFELAGQYVGLGDWRPGSPKSPGRYGTFESRLSQGARN